jgi:hypothetical protein
MSMTTSQGRVLAAKLYLDPNGSIVRSAELFSPSVIESCRDGSTTLIDMAQMPAVSSTYFNVLFRDVAEAIGVDATKRVDLVNATPLLKQVFERSREAIIKIVGTTHRL